jgi:hypothetical protein
MRAGEVVPDDALNVIRDVRANLDLLDDEGHDEAEVVLREWLVTHDVEFA